MVHPSFHVIKIDFQLHYNRAVEINFSKETCFQSLPTSVCLLSASRYTLFFLKLKLYTQVRCKIKLHFGFETFLTGLNFRQKLKSRDIITKPKSIGFPSCSLKNRSNTSPGTKKNATKIQGGIHLHNASFNKGLSEGIHDNASMMFSPCCQLSLSHPAV